MSEPRGLTSVPDALSIVRRHVVRLPAIRVPIEQAAGLTLAEPVAADHDHPPFDKAMMDGFAVRSADFSGSPTTLEIVGELAAGEVWKYPIEAAQTLRINTGAPMPLGTDAMIIIEHAWLSADGRQMTTPDRPRPGAHVAPRAIDMRAGACVLEPSQLIGPAQLAAAASAGAAVLSVYRRPRLTILSTGDELVPLTMRPQAGQIRNSSSVTLAELGRQAGCEVTDLGICPDIPDQLAENVSRGLQSDVFCISGGVSMGQHDHVPSVLARAGVQIHLQKVAIKPGKPLLFGIGPAGQTVFGLPGNPVSSFVCFLVFVRAAIAGMQGRPVAMPPLFQAVLQEPIGPAGERMEFIPVHLERDGSGGWSAKATRWQGSADVFGLAKANSLMVREALASAATKGSRVQVMPLGSD